MDCPVQRTELQLTGGWFTLPLVVWMGGRRCLNPELLAMNGNTTLCTESTGNETGNCRGTVRV